MNLAVVILAAGKGTRMKSDLPKVLHPIAGRPMVQHVVDAAGALDPDNTVLIYGHGGDAVRQAVTGSRLQWAEQAEQLGTGHAVAQAMPHVKEDMVLVLYGDVPLIRPETLKDFVASVDDNTLALMTLTLNDPNGYGRIVRDGQNNVQRIVEQKDASEAELGIQEINTGILACSRRFLEE
ncbi:MAG: NTP transferase domain-containing protein, partial [Gammaproteobacteria bacterium]|nr:NTP transferase domain-containing protein [Gammaproteobacteria bacterium]